MSKRSHLDEKWYVINPPHGDGTIIIAGHNDPNVGLFVCDCEFYDVGIQEWIEANPRWDVASPRELAQRIARDHNECIKLRRKIEVLEDRNEQDRTVKQDIEDLFGDD